MIGPYHDVMSAQRKEYQRRSPNEDGVEEDLVARINGVGGVGGVCTSEGVVPLSGNASTYIWRSKLR